MNFKSISYFLSFFCFPISILAFINILYSSYFDYFLSIDAYSVTLLISLFLVHYFIMEKIYIDDVGSGFPLVLVHLLSALLIAIPFYLSTNQVTFLNSFFESISGWTTTGATV